MRRLHRLAYAVVWAAANAAPAPEFESWVEAIRGETRSQEAMQWTRDVYATDRWLRSMVWSVMPAPLSSTLRN
jgi:hypothetical protein